MPANQRIVYCISNGQSFSVVTVSVWFIADISGYIVLALAFQGTHLSNTVASTTYNYYTVNS